MHNVALLNHIIAINIIIITMVKVNSKPSIITGKVIQD